jgi:hypothetical protein
VFCEISNKCFADLPNVIYNRNRPKEKYISEKNGRSVERDGNAKEKASDWD